MKKLLYHFDTDAIPSVFDSVVAYDGGADHVTQLAGITPENCYSLVEGAIYTRAPKNKKNTALFVGGSDLAAGQELFAAVPRAMYFPSEPSDFANQSYHLSSTRATQLKGRCDDAVLELATIVATR